MEKLNFFNPFKDKDITHEDVLTRNFLLLLKNIPAVQIAFFELIKQKLPTIGLTDQGSVAKVFADLSVRMGIRQVIEKVNTNALAA